MTQPIEGELRWFVPQRSHYHCWSISGAGYAVTRNGEKVLQQYIGGEWRTVPNVFNDALYHMHSVSALPEVQPSQKAGNHDAADRF